MLRSYHGGPPPPTWTDSSAWEAAFRGAESLGHLPGRQLPQCVIDQRQQLLADLGVALLDVGEGLGEVGDGKGFRAWAIPSSTESYQVVQGFVR